MHAMAKLAKNRQLLAIRIGCQKWPLGGWRFWRNWRFWQNRHACNGETGEKSPASSDLNWMPKVAPWRLAILAKIFVYILAIKRQFCHFRQNRHFPKVPFAISFEFLFTVWRFWRLIANSAIFAKITTLQRAPLPSHLNYCLRFCDFGD